MLTLADSCCLDQQSNAISSGFPSQKCIQEVELKATLRPAGPSSSGQSYVACQSLVELVLSTPHRPLPSQARILCHPNSQKKSYSQVSTSLPNLRTSPHHALVHGSPPLFPLSRRQTTTVQKSRGKKQTRHSTREICRAHFGATTRPSSLFEVRALVPRA